MENVVGLLLEISKTISHNHSSLKNYPVSITIRVDGFLDDVTHNRNTEF